MSLLSSGCSHIRYLWQAGMGQWSIYNHERPIEEAISDPRTPEKIREQLQWIGEIKKFVETELGVKATSNYTTYSDIKRPYVVWSLTSAQKYELKLNSWSFPIVGSFPYLGFFNKEMAEEWQKKEIEKGMDTSLRGVTAYSTIGYLRDPILSSMLTKKKADLVNLIFHETTHSQVYIKGEGAFNEQIASYIGDYGERYWIEKTFGLESAEYKNWTEERKDRRLFGKKMVEFAERLKTLFTQIVNDSEEIKNKKKSKMYQEFQNELLDEKKSPFLTSGWKKYISSRFVPEFNNNALLLAHLTYEDNQEVFDYLYDLCLNGDSKNVKGSLKGSLRVFKRFAEHRTAETATASLASERNLTKRFETWLRSQAGSSVCFD